MGGEAIESFDESPSFRQSIQGRNHDDEQTSLADLGCNEHGWSGGVGAISPRVVAMARGPESTGVAPDSKPPIEWSDTKNIAWKVAIPGKGHSTPLVVVTQCS